MKLHEIIEAMNEPTNSILVEELAKYKNSLYTYYKDMFCSEPVLMVTDVMNAAQYARIESHDNYFEAVQKYVDSCHLDSEEEENNYTELINYQSIMLSEF